MSRIRRLSIRGIRNFGDENDEAKIRFSRPLTLILGPNGTGKTTIIEALKYAVTGEFPPGSDRGKSFIHDPILTRTSSVRGLIKAELYDTSGTVLTVCRVMEASRGNAVMRFKTIDSSVTRTMKGSDQAISLTNRCANVDEEITSAMGVSKPIFNYVIFCHQEELNWPLQDGKKLKEKFDEIFDSVRFNKALESIMKYCKEMQTSIRLLKEQKRTFYLTVSEVRDKEAKLKDCKQRLEYSIQKVNDINKELEPIMHRIKKIDQRDSEYKALLVEEEKKRMEYNVSKEQLNTLRKNIQNVFNGTNEELNSEIESHDEILKRKSDNITEHQQKLKDINKKEETVTHMLAEERVILGTLKQQLKDQENKIALRNTILNKALSAWNFDTVGSDVSEIEISVLTKRLREKMNELIHKVDGNRLKMEQEEKELQKNVDTLRTQHSKINLEKTLKENEVLETRIEIDKNRSKIGELSASINTLNCIETKIEEARNEVAKLNEQIDTNFIKEEINTKVELQHQLEARINLMDEEIMSLHKQASFQTELELHESALLAKEKKIDELKKKHENCIKVLLNVEEFPQTRLKPDLDAVRQKLVNEISVISQEIQKEERRLTSTETIVLHNEGELLQKKKEMETNKQKISTVCCYTNFDEELLLQSKKVKDLQDKRGMYAHQVTAYKQYIKQLNDEDPCCPLCHRDFNNRETVQNLLKQMRKEMESHPNRLEECEAELKIQQEKYDIMLQVKPLVERVIQVEKGELNKLMENLEKTKKEVKQSQMLIAKLKEERVNPQLKLVNYEEVISDIILWDRNIEEISNLKEVINSLQDRINSTGIKSEYTLEEAQAQKENLKISLQNVRLEIESLQSKIHLHNEKMQDARNLYNTLREDQLKVHSDMQTLKQLKDKQEALCKREISLTKSVDDLRQVIAVAESELNLGIHQLEDKKKENWEKQEADRQLVLKKERHLTELRSIQEEIDLLLRRDVPSALKNLEYQVESYQKSITGYLREKSDVEKSVNKLKEEIHRQEIRKRELTDNIVLRKTRETTLNLKEQCALLKEQIKSINNIQIVEERKQLQNREEVLLRQKNMAKGNQEELERLVEQYIQELKKEIYRRACADYKSKCIELTVQEEALLNLKAYSKVLDAAMMEYHEERMRTVNKIIKQMWKIVYTGSDTTSIEIRTEATEGVGNARRTYNYKLIQTKHGHEMDMKGRCSAGQKVLASIIIRLALAETFCKDCGILALDEPTTNLDEENVDSLATALANVVKLRSKYQKNFQLIIISHDEKFLLKLAGLNNKNGVYELYRKPNGLTGIKFCQVDTRDNFAVDVIKEEISSDEESNVQTEKQMDKQQQNIDLCANTHNQSPLQKKRYGWQDRDSEQGEGRPQKRRYVFNVSS